MKILVIANYTSLPWNNGNGRFMYLINKIDRKENSIELVTSNFRHSKKEKRSLNKKEMEKIDYKITLLNEPGYKKNVSLKRLYSHYILSKNLKKYLKNLDYKPDVIYCAVPSLDVANVAVHYANKMGIKVIIDIQDLWPEAFRMAINIPIISDIVFYPMMKKANYIYSHSDEIIAVSQTYVDRALKVNKKVKSGCSVFLGTDLDYFDKCAKENRIERSDNIVKIAYIGTLGTSYDIKSVIDAINILNKKGINEIEFIVMGDGPLREVFKKYARTKKIKSEFTGRLEYPNMVGLLSSCDIAVNPIIGTSVASIINKVGDYAAAGLPVINTQKSEEYRELVEHYNAGFNCNNVSDISEKMELLIKDMELRKKMGIGNRRLAEERFDRKKTYDEIIKKIISL